MGLNAGDLDREIRLQTATRTQDPDSGEEVIDWDDIEEETLWAQWLPAGTREAYYAQQRLEAQIDGVYRIYYRTPKPDATLNRIVDDEGTVFDLKPPIEIERKEGWEIPVVARA